MNVECCYTSCNANPTPAVVDWGKNNLICYGSCNSVRIWDPNYGAGGKVINTLTQHVGRVNSVRWLRGNDVDVETELVSGSSDGNTIVWSLNREILNYVLPGLKDNISIVDGLYCGKFKQDTIVVSVSMNSTINIWYRHKVEDEFSAPQLINLGRGLCVAVRISLIPQINSVILAAALDDSSIKLFTRENPALGEFIASATLKGHEDWVRGLDFYANHAKSELLLASASQDTFIRVWRISADADDNSSITSFQLANKTISVSLDSVLAGHEGWIYSVNWNLNTLQLLSASLDKTMIIWEFDPQLNIWFEKMRVGEVGGNTLGFYGGVFGPFGKTILAHGYHGAFHMWNCVEEVWTPSVTVGGHFNEVVDLVWDPEGAMFVMSVSEDQTTRIHAPWSKSHIKKVTWHEIARPQIHGYDMSSLAMISRYKFVSGAEEKVIRAFEAPVNFVENFKRICGISSNDSPEVKAPKGASVPSLGLSNKAVYSSNNVNDVKVNSKDPYPEESHFTAVELNEPPTEETLLQNTLWPEIQKLYGHGYEIYSLAASPDGQLLASACKATTVEHAAILLWETNDWNQIQKLHSHNLTVAQMAFSPNSQFLLSVSRDRRWSIFKRNEDSKEFALFATVDKKTSVHTRIIWCCAWTYDSEYFATGSRDGKVVVWEKAEEVSDGIIGRYKPASQALEEKDSVTALAFASEEFGSGYLLAVGFESGTVSLFEWKAKCSQAWRRLFLFNKELSHHLTVKRLAFRPVSGIAGAEDEDSNVLQLASCASDFCVRIYNLNVLELLST